MTEGAKKPVRPAADDPSQLPRGSASPLRVAGILAGVAAVALVGGVTIWLVAARQNITSDDVKAAADRTPPALTQTHGPVSTPAPARGPIEEKNADGPTRDELAAQANLVDSISTWQSIAGLKSFGVSNASLQVSRVWRASAGDVSAADKVRDAVGATANYICVEVAIHNKSPSPLKYRGWNSYGPHGAILADESGNVLPLVPLAQTSLVERMTEGNVPGHGSVSEVLVFEAPQRADEVLHLVLPYGVFYSNVRPPYRAIELTPDMVGIELAGSATADAALADATTSGGPAKRPATARPIGKTKEGLPPSIKDIVDNDPGFPAPAPESPAAAEKKAKETKGGDKSKPEEEKPKNPFEPKTDKQPSGESAAPDS